MIDCSISHCGAMLCSFDKTIELMPKAKPMLGSSIFYLELKPEVRFT
jgi:hypothetical protein